MLTIATLLPAVILKTSAQSNNYFSGLFLEGSLSPPFHLACFLAYASINLLPEELQG